MITCRSAVYGYTPSTHDYMPSITVLPCHQLSVPPKPTFLLLVMLESWHPTFARLLLHQAEMVTHDWQDIYTL
jgi:hypothetical protein